MSVSRLFSKLLATIVVSSTLFGNAAVAHEDSNVEVFYSYESSDHDSIQGVGIALTQKNEDSHFGFQVSTSFNDARVTATDGWIEDYFAWEAGIKFGHFSDISIYAMAGIDLTELVFHDLRYDDYDYQYEEHDDIDAYVGVGIGANLGLFKIEGFTKLREIDSKYWESESEVFTGVQFSLVF